MRKEVYYYDGYLCVQRLDATQGNAVRTEFVWDPTEPVATRPLAMRAKNWGLNLFYSHDGNKNVSEVFYHAPQNGIAAHYDYAPFGVVTRTSSATRVTNRDLISENPFRFSSEYHDAPTALVYYNYRHYNPLSGRWLGRDCLQDTVAGWNPYAFVRNYAISAYDLLGLWLSPSHKEFTVNIFTKLLAEHNLEMTPEMEAILEYIVNANVNTDSGEYEVNLYYHFNRGLREGKEKAIENYIHLQKEEIHGFLGCLRDAKHATCEIKKEKCREALEHLGRIAHMWQDYFAHGINPTKESNVGEIRGNPLRPEATPSSWNGFWDDKGEHGAVWTVLGHFLWFPSIEPGWRAPDYEFRRSRSEEVTEVLFRRLFPIWTETCGCIDWKRQEDSLWETLKSWF